MIILAVETSCDDTSLALFKNKELLSMDTQSQIKIHNITGGVVPEVAAREHANAIFEVFENVLKEAKIAPDEIDYIAVTSHPGLIPSLLTGITFARTLGKILKKEVLELNHIEGHIFSNFLEREEGVIPFPAVCLTVSGGHNDIFLLKSMFEMEKIGTSGDDAAGESYDKVAKMMGLSYPGGPVISSLAQEYMKKEQTKNLFPRVWLKKDEYDFSFSGLKSAVKREIDARIEKSGGLSPEDKKEISYEFQNAVNEVLSYKLISAAKQNNITTILLSGGVSANTDLRDKIQQYAKKEDMTFFAPVKNIYSMDNAAMIGILAYYKIKYQL